MAKQLAKQRNPFRCSNLWHIEMKTKGDYEHPQSSIHMNFVLNRTNIREPSRHRLLYNQIFQGISNIANNYINNTYFIYLIPDFWLLITIVASDWPHTFLQSGCFFSISLLFVSIQKQII